MSFLKLCHIAKGWNCYGSVINLIRAQLTDSVLGVAISLGLFLMLPEIFNGVMKE